MLSQFAFQQYLNLVYYLTYIYHIIADQGKSRIYTFDYCVARVGIGDNLYINRNWHIIRHIYHQRKVPLCLGSRRFASLMPLVAA